jgi:hypothetical protein
MLASEKTKTIIKNKIILIKKESDVEKKIMFF